MHQLTNEIIASREWRARELENLKKMGLISLSTVSQKTKEQYYRMCIPYIYAHWEGFVVESFKQIISYINNMYLEKSDVCNKLYAFSLKNELKPLSGKQGFTQICEFVNSFTENYSKKLYIDSTLVSAKSNLNYKQLVIMLDELGMEPQRVEKYKREINQLVNQRNKIAHGENGIIITYDNVAFYIQVLQEIYDELILIMDEYLSDQKYLKDE